MNILHVVESLDRGGLERVVVDLALSQKMGGRNVTVCCLFHRGALAAELDAAGIGVHIAGKTSGPDLGAIRRLRDVIRESHAEVIHTHNATANYYCAMALWFNRKLKLVNTRHGMGAAETDSWKERLYRMSLFRTSVAAAVCDRAASHFVQQGIIPTARVGVVKNGIRLEKIAGIEPDARQRVRRSLGIGIDAFVVGTVGRLNWAKDHAMLIESFAKLRRCERDRLLIIGGGDLRESLEEKIRELGVRESVQLLGDRSDVPELLAALDTFAMTSVTEGYSIALLEAAASGLPMVASDVGGNREIVQEGKTGFLVSPRVAAGFASAIQKLSDDTQLRRRMAEEARSWAAQNAGLESMVSAYDKLYAIQ